MSITDAEVTETIFDAADKMALAMGMRPEEDMTELSEGQRVMMVTENGIVVGKIRVVEMESRGGNAKFVTYLLMDTIAPPLSFSETRLCKYMFLRNANGGWNDEGDIACSLPDGAALYV